MQCVVLVVALAVSLCVGIRTITICGHFTDYSVRVKTFPRHTGLDEGRRSKHRTTLLVSGGS